MYPLSLVGVVFLSVAPCVVSIGGTYDRELIHDRILQHQRRYEACYNEALRTNRAVEGHVEVRITIEASGIVSESVAVVDEVGDGVGQCVAEAFYDVRLPELTGSSERTRVSYGFKFIPPAETEYPSGGCSDYLEDDWFCVSLDPAD